MTRRIVVAGQLKLDARFEIEKWIEYAGLEFAKEFSLEPGGKTINAAVAARRLGADVTIIAPLGDDFAGEMIRQVLIKEKISTANLLSVPTPTALVNVISMNGQPSYIVGNMEVPPKIATALELNSKSGKLFDQDTIFIAN